MSQSSVEVVQSKIPSPLSTIPSQTGLCFLVLPVTDELTYVKMNAITDLAILRFSFFSTPFYLVLCISESANATLLGFS